MRQQCGDMFGMRMGHGVCDQSRNTRAWYVNRVTLLSHTLSHTHSHTISHTLSHTLSLQVRHHRLSSPASSAPP
jgi:hypothetical protein